MSQITCSYVKSVVWFFFLSSANLICRSTDITKCFRWSLRLRDNKSRLYLFSSGWFLFLVSFFYYNVSKISKISNNNNEEGETKKENRYNYYCYYFSKRKKQKNWSLCLMRRPDFCAWNVMRAWIWRVCSCSFKFWQDEKFNLTRFHIITFFSCRKFILRKEKKEKKAWKYFF